MYLDYLYIPTGMQRQRVRHRRTALRMSGSRPTRGRIALLKAYPQLRNFNGDVQDWNI
jgi:hypothetical protein